MPKKRKLNEIRLTLTDAEMRMAQRAASMCGLTIGSWASACVAGESSRFIRHREKSNAAVKVTNGP